MRFIGFFLGSLFKQGFFLALAPVLTLSWVFFDLPNTDKLRAYSSGEDPGLSSELSEAEIAALRPAVISRAHSYDGAMLWESTEERRLYMPAEDIPSLVKQAFISAEDKNFYAHPGFDPAGIARALLSNIEAEMAGGNRRPEGASTITQQVAQNFFLSKDVDYIRKLKEILLAMRLEGTFTKEKILELYLNRIFLGENSYGVAVAALTYFDKSLDELTVAEAAYLAALPKAPSNYHPVRDKARAIERRTYVIDQMLENGYLTAAQAREAKAADLVTVTRQLGTQYTEALYFVDEVKRKVTSLFGRAELETGGLSIRSTLDSRYQTIAQTIFREGLMRYDRAQGWRGAITQIELGQGWPQRLAAVPNPPIDVPGWSFAVILSADDVVEVGLRDGSTGVIPAEGRWRGSRRPSLKPGDVIAVEKMKDGEGRYAVRQIPEINGGMVVIDPFSGRVLALVGGFSWGSSNFNRATQACRQPGSTFKPFVYATALDNGFTPSSPVSNAAKCLPGGRGLWCPKNAGGGSGGSATLRVGLEKSRNLMTVHLANGVGMRKVRDYVERALAYPTEEEALAWKEANPGQTPDCTEKQLAPVLSSALGSGETTVMRISGGYAPFLNGGRAIEPSIIDRIQDRFGRTKWRHDDRDCENCDAPDGWTGQEEPLLPAAGKEMFDARTGFQIVKILEGVVQRGTARNAFKAAFKNLDADEVKNLQIGGKTGTTNDAKDVWFIGFSCDLIVGAYMGYETPRPLRGGSFGGTVVAPVVAAYFKQILPSTGALPFRTPPGVVMQRVNAASGRPTSADDPGAIMEPFKLGTDPDSVRGRDAEDEEDYPAEEPPPPPPEAVSTGTGGLY